MNPLCKEGCAFCPVTEVGGADGLRKTKSEAVEKGESQYVEVTVVDPKDNSEVPITFFVSRFVSTPDITCNHFGRFAGVVKI